MYCTPGGHVCLGKVPGMFVLAIVSWVTDFRPSVITFSPLALHSTSVTVMSLRLLSLLNQTPDSLDAVSSVPVFPRLAVHEKDVKDLTRTEGTCTGTIGQSKNERAFRELRLKRACVDSFALAGQLLRLRARRCLGEVVLSQISISLEVAQGSGVE